MANTAAALPSPEAREHERHDTRLEVNANLGHQFFTGFTENISAGGLFVQTYQVMPLGSRFKLQFGVPGIDYDFDTTCEVRWVREYSDITPHILPGMGLRFLDLSPLEEKILNEALRRTDTLFYDD